jgi:hypothetical protein
MKQFFNVLGQDLRRTVLSKVFLISVVGLVCTNLITLFDELQQYTTADIEIISVLYIEVLMSYRDFNNVFLLFAAIPGATLFCSDWDNRYIRFSIMRSNKRIYAAGKATACFLSAVLTEFIAEWLTALALMTKYPLYFQSGSSFGDFDMLITPEGTPIYLLLVFLFKSFCAGFLSVAALWFSTKITNMFVTLATPMLFYYLIEVLDFFFRFPSKLSIDYLIKAEIIFGNPVYSTLYTLGVFLVLSVIFGFMFAKSCKRRVLNG